MDSERHRWLSWLGANIIPYEPDVRLWLRRALRDRNDVNDVIQEAYCRICAAPNPDLIVNGRAFFFKVVRNIVTDQIRRDRVVRIEAVAEIETLPGLSDDLSPERITAFRRELEKVQGLIDALPDRCRRIFEMRKIQGLSQKEIAGRLGVTEAVVENEAVRGLSLVLKALETEGQDAHIWTGVSSRERHRERPRRR